MTSKAMLIPAVVCLAACCCFAQPDMRSGWDLVPIDGWRNPEMRAWTADLIVVGKIVKLGDAEELDLKLPFRDKAGTWSFVTYTVEVKEVIALRALPADGSPAKPAGAPAKGGTVRVLTSAYAVAADKPIQFKGLPIRHDSEPVVGQTYLLILYRLTGRTEYYLPANAGYWDSPDAQNIKAIRSLLDTSKWPWGKAESGLQIALFAPSEAEMRLGGAPMNVAVALRNASDKPVTIVLNPMDMPMSLSATGADGKPVPIKLYAGPCKEPAGGWRRKLEPGDVVFIKPLGLATEMTLVTAGIGEGKWTLHAEFSGRGTSAFESWIGKVQSKPVEVEVRPEEVRPPGGA